MPPSDGNKQWLGGGNGFGPFLFVGVKTTMPTSKPSAAKLRERQKHAQKWLQRRKDYLITQCKLAEMMGVSRREIQMIEAGRVIPRFST